MPSASSCLTAVLAIAAPALLIACGGGSDATGGASPTAMSSTGALQATLHASSDPPPLGDQTVSLDLVYADGGAPASGLSLTVVPWMPAMQHGTSIVPMISETTPGTYTISHAYLFMPGIWEMRTSVAANSSAGIAADKVAPSLDVP